MMGRVLREGCAAWQPFRIGLASNVEANVLVPNVHFSILNVLRHEKGCKSGQLLAWDGFRHSLSYT